MKKRITALTEQAIRWEILKKGIDDEEEYKKIKEKVLSELSDEEVTRYNIYIAHIRPFKY